MVRALADMPADLAEEAVSRYARSVDEHVRNPQGFMVRHSLMAALLGWLACCYAPWTSTRTTRRASW